MDLKLRSFLSLACLPQGLRFSLQHGTPRCLLLTLERGSIHLLMDSAGNIGWSWETGTRREFRPKKSQQRAQKGKVTNHASEDTEDKTGTIPVEGKDNPSKGVHHHPALRTICRERFPHGPDPEKSIPNSLERVPLNRLLSRSRTRDEILRVSVKKKYQAMADPERAILGKPWVPMHSG